jgi:hypothetical protein
MKVTTIPDPNSAYYSHLCMINYDELVKWLGEQIEYYGDPPTYCGVESMKEYYLKKDVYQTVLAYVIRKNDEN